MILKRTRSHGVVSIGFACENCHTRHIVKQDRTIAQPPLPMPAPRRGRRGRHHPPSS
ncbi:MAG: hypothetical protein QM589_06390 [Thermomicrobiales bacterium]